MALRYFWMAVQFEHDQSHLAIVALKNAFLERRFRSRLSGRLLEESAGLGK